MSATAQEVLDYLVTRLSGALRRPGRYGGEMAIRPYFDAVAFADATAQAWQQDLKGPVTRRGFSSIGVRGAFQDLWSDAHEGVVASEPVFNPQVIFFRCREIEYAGPPGVVPRTVAGQEDRFEVAEPG